MALRGDSSNRADDHGSGQDIQKSESYQRGCDQAARREVRISQSDHFIESWDSPLNPGADTADEEVSIQRHLAKEEDRTFLGLPIELREGCDRDITFPHNPGSAP